MARSPLVDGMGRQIEVNVQRVLMDKLLEDDTGPMQALAFAGSS
jgi:hypothetical protein